MFDKYFFIYININVGIKFLFHYLKLKNIYQVKIH